MKRSIAAVIFALAPWIAAEKCIEADPVLTKMNNEDAAIAGEDAGSTRDATVVVTLPCSEPGTARIRVRDLQYQIQCGCRETSGKTCTISAGTRVVWTFADSEDHDIASVGDVFPSSGERSSGTFSNVFATPGEFPYLCNIHSVEMTGYTISVQ